MIDKIFWGSIQEFDGYDEKGKQQTSIQNIKYNFPTYEVQCLGHENEVPNLTNI